MDGLAPIHQICCHLQSCLASGESMRKAIDQILSGSVLSGRINSSDCQDLQKICWYFDTNNQLSWPNHLSPVRQVLYKTIYQGLSGQPCLEILNQIEPEIRRLCSQNIDQYIGRLPLKTTLILMGLCVPGLLILFFGFFLSKFMAQLLSSGGLF